MEFKIQQIESQSVPHFALAGLSDKAIAKKKKSLVSHQLLKIEKGNPYSNAEKEKKLWSKRMFFLEYQNSIYLCGICANNQKRDKVSKNCIKSHSVSDYILFSMKAGFYILKECEDAGSFNADEFFYIPTVYYQNSNEWNRILSGVTYNAIDFKQVLAKRTSKTYLVNESNPLRAIAQHEIDIVMDTEVLKEIPCGYNSEELPLDSDWIVGMGDEDNEGFLFNWKNDTYTRLRRYSDKRFPYDSRYTVASIMIDSRNTRLKTEDESNYYFYISKTNTVAFIAAMRCITHFGSCEVMKNMFSLDSTVNYKLSIPKNENADAISFMMRITMKSKAIAPRIFGCAIKDVVEVLCKPTYNPFELPAHKIDEQSAENVIEYIYSHTDLESPADIIKNIVELYGECAVAPVGGFQPGSLDSNIQLDFFPSSMEKIVGCPMNSKFLEKLDESILPDKWKSESELYELVRAYYPNLVNRNRESVLAAIIFDTMIFGPKDYFVKNKIRQDILRGIPKDKIMYNARTFDSFIEIVLDGKHSINDIVKQNPQYSTYVEHGLFAGHDTNYYHELSEIDFLSGCKSISLPLLLLIGSRDCAIDFKQHLFFFDSISSTESDIIHKEVFSIDHSFRNETGSIDSECIKCICDFIFEIVMKHIPFDGGRA